jgi:hypothetical protein
MMDGCCEYLPVMESKALPSSNDALVMGIIFLQHRMIQRPADKIHRSANEKG